MHIFIGKILGRNNEFTPKDYKKQKLYQDILSTYKAQGINVKITIEPVSKNINEAQEGLYKAYILKAANFFGEDFPGMEKNLEHLMPEGPRGRWSSKELNDFIDKASAFLGPFGFTF